MPPLPRLPERPGAREQCELIDAARAALGGITNAALAGRLVRRRETLSRWRAGAPIPRVVRDALHKIIQEHAR